MFGQRQEINGENTVADNGSTDSSVHIAEEAGVCVVRIPERGYGNALMGGIRSARGKYVFMADSDMSYDFFSMENFLNKMKEEDCDIVIGCRLPWKGGIIDKDAMPLLNKYLGNPFLSGFAKLLFRLEINDFHCGSRMVRRESFMKLNLSKTGMEFASEMLVKAHVAGLKISEIPVTLRNDMRDRRPHLKPFRDGFRHLYFLIEYRLELLRGRPDLNRQPLP